MEETGVRFLLLLAAASLSVLILVQVPVRFAHDQRRRLQGGENPPYPVYDRLLLPQEIAELMSRWKVEYSEFVRVTTVHDEYDLPRPGAPEDCPFDEGDGCLVYMVTIQDYTLHPEDSDSSSRLPEVFWSGTVHGKERVGPTATIHAASLLLQAASCQGAINRSHQQESDADTSQDCRQALLAQGVDDVQRRWLSRLVSTRRIVYLPSANIMGFARNERVETIEYLDEDGDPAFISLDPNTDFPYDTSERAPTDCMRSITARAINEVYRDHLFQIGLTFHAGVGPLIGFEWGNPSYLGYLSPDHTAQQMIAAAYSRYGGSFGDTPNYMYTTMNSENLWLNGAMEDWAYAASFDEPLVTQCNVTTYGGYPAAKTIYNNSTLRSFTMLVETSLRGQPIEELGTGFDVLNKDAADNGHVSRNVRLAISAVDLVEPYVSILAVDHVSTTDDITSRQPPHDRLDCQRMKRVTVPNTTSSVAIRWTVGGSLEIDETSLWYGKWDIIPRAAWSCMEQADARASSFFSSFLTRGSGQSALNGSGYFSEAGASPPGSPGEALGPVFESSIDLTSFSNGDEIFVVARARVDQSWAEPLEDDLFRPRISPQSHIVRARTDPGWYHQSAGMVVQGRLDWYTIVPLTLVIAPVDSIERNTFSSAAWTVFSASASILTLILTTIQLG